MAAAKEFLIINRRTGKALQATGLDNGQAICQAEINRSDAQIWTSKETEGGVKLINKAASKVMDVVMGGKSDGSWIHIWDDVENGNGSQVWKITGRTYKKIINLASGKALDIEGMLENDGAHAQIWEDLGGENQQWKLEPLAAKTVTKTGAARSSAAKAKPAAKKTKAAAKTTVKGEVKSAAKSAEKKTAVKAKAEVKPAAEKKAAQPKKAEAKKSAGAEKKAETKATEKKV